MEKLFFPVNPIFRSEQNYDDIPAKTALFLYELAMQQGFQEKFDINKNPSEIINLSMGFLSSLVEIKYDTAFIYHNTLYFAESVLDFPAIYLPTGDEFYSKFLNKSIAKATKAFIIGFCKNNGLSEPLHNGGIFENHDVWYEDQIHEAEEVIKNGTNENDADHEFDIDELKEKIEYLKYCKDQYPYEFNLLWEEYTDELIKKDIYSAIPDNNLEKEFIEMIIEAYESFEKENSVFKYSPNAYNEEDGQSIMPYDKLLVCANRFMYNSYVDDLNNYLNSGSFDLGLYIWEAFLPEHEKIFQKNPNSIIKQITTANDIRSERFEDLYRDKLY